MRQVISAMQYLHSREVSIIHRDIKPENLIIDENGVLKLADFGWANYVKNNKKRHSYCGTPEYLSPEMIKKMGHDKPLDIWNLGVLLFEMLTGDVPFDGNT